MSDQVYGFHPDNEVFLVQSHINEADNRYGVVKTFHYLVMFKDVDKKKNNEVIHKLAWVNADEHGTISYLGLDTIAKVGFFKSGVAKLWAHNFDDEVAFKHMERLKNFDSTDLERFDFSLVKRK